MSANPIPDPSQQPITASDPRVQQILAMIQAKAAQSQVAPSDTPSQGQVVPAAPPPVPTQLGGPTMAQQVPPEAGPPPPQANLAPMGVQQMPQLPPPADPNVV